MSARTGLWDASKASLGSHSYTPYGASYADTGAGTVPRFTGHQWDPTSDLYYAAYRYYSPDLARWLGRDPLGMKDGPNLYQYVKANPVLRLDPTGCEESFAELLAGLVFILVCTALCDLGCIAVGLTGQIEAFLGLLGCGALCYTLWEYIRNPIPYEGPITTGNPYPPGTSQWVDWEEEHNATDWGDIFDDVFDAGDDPSDPRY